MRDRTITIRMTPEMHEQLKEAAKERHTSINELVVRWLSETTRWRPVKREAPPYKEETV